MAQNRFNKLRWESVDEIIRSNAGGASAQIKALLQKDQEFRPFVVARINELPGT